MFVPVRLTIRMLACMCLAAAVASAASEPARLGGCTHDIECDDGIPCTSDECDFPASGPVGSGTCVHTTVADGQPGGIFACPAEMGLLCGGCDDGLFCNGPETCQGGACISGTPPCSGGQVCSEALDFCQPSPCSSLKTCIGGPTPGGTCTSNSNCGIGGLCRVADCDDGLHCNGEETCVSGICEASENPCGFGATCGERKCSGTSSTYICMTDGDCAHLSGSTCSLTGPICIWSRCCNNSAEPICSLRSRKGFCSGSTAAGTNAGSACTTSTDCQTGFCSGTNSCNSVGGKFYAFDDGGRVPCGGACDPTCSPYRCPKYGSGIAPHGPALQQIGPVSDSSISRAMAGASINRLGDDYTFSNTGVCVGGSRDGLGCADNAACTGGGVCNLAGPSVMLINYLRILGTIVHPTSLKVEFRDAAGRLADRRWVPAAGSGIVVLYLDPPVIVPSSGFVILSVDSANTPDGAFFWSSTDAVDIGSNDPGVLWLNDGPVANFLSPNSGVLAFELEGEKVAAPLGACCDDAAASCSDGVLPWVCTGDGNAFQGVGSVCPIPACELGACCNAATGACTVGSETDCNSAGGEFQGFGTGCDADNGHDAGSQHCCPQPAASGADRCQDAIVHSIAVPPSGSAPVVVTITGDNSSATYQSEDTCCPPNVGCSLDLGWWEAFEIDREAYVRIDYCCTDPVKRPSGSPIYPTCPCSSGIYATANPFRYPEPGMGWGSPYCTDGNRWMNYGPLAAGIYYIPVNSMLSGTHGPYQMHITVDALPTAGCCVQDQCTDGVNQLECDALGGTFLAPPQKFPAVADCSNDPCETGSCCPGPGECFDVALGQPVTKEHCDGLQGTYHGGVRCEGGTCDNDSVVSCQNDSDCPSNGNCIILPAQQEQPSPCPACEIGSSTSCQPFENVLEFGISDRSMDMLIADDFVPLGTILTDVCVWGFYLHLDPDAQTNDCSFAVSEDYFRVRVFANDPTTQRMPGALVGESMTNVERVFLPQPLIIGTLLDTQVYAFRLALDSPITLTPGTIYWLEVSNDPTISGPIGCVWFWNQTQPRDEGYSFAGSQGSYQPSHAMPADQVFCTNIALEPSNMGLRPGACCRCDESCTAETLQDCANDNGIWHIVNENCTGVICPAAPPVNDNCIDGPTVITDGSYTFHNQCATTDGYPFCDFDFYAPEFDLWYQFIAPMECVLVISTCHTGLRFDTEFGVHHNPPLLTDCPPCPLDGQTQFETLAGICQDESCTVNAVGGAGYWNSLDQIGRPAQQGECFLIRVGSFPGSRGTGILDVRCEPYCIPSMGPPCEPMPFSAARFIGIGCGLFHPCANPTPVVGAIRVRLTSLHHVNPPYTGGPSIPFTSFEGQVRWVGPPTQYVESAANPLPLWVSQLQCTPHYRDWNDLPAVYVTGTEIVPSSSYEYEMLHESCAGIEDTCTDRSPTFTATTTRWGDVWTPFNPPDVSVQPDVADISALVNKFRNAPGAPSKVQALLAGAPGNSFGKITHEVLNVDFSFSHISACVDAFRGVPYPYTIGTCP